MVKTGEDGTFDLRYDHDTLKVSGDEWFFLDDGKPYIPLGTLTVEETSAPQGYLVDADVKLYTVTDDDIGGGGLWVDVFNAKLDPSDEAVRRAGLTVVKHLP